MKPRLQYRDVAALPKLAWLASLELKGGTLELLHGSAVECRDDWMVEGVWDADFCHGNFHRSENFFGSGVRVENGSVFFVPSSGLVDRLLFCFHNDLLLVSNSLVLLLAFTGARLCEEHDYRIESNAICNGIKDYRKEFPVLHSEIPTFYQLYHENLVVTDGRISFESKNGARTVHTFDEYSRLLTSALNEIRHNYEDRSRVIRFSAFSTLSSGYDSVAVTCLAREIGVTTCFVSPARSKWKPSYWVFRNAGLDEGQPVADALDLRAIPLRAIRTTEESSSDVEPYFYAATCASFELIFHTMANHIERNCAAAVVFTGYHGGRLWDVNATEKFLGDDIKRGDVSGLTLSEIRLKSGFINVAVPFILARSIRSLVEISRSPEMEPWRLGNSYDRPIPRRIAETAGVGRELFGMRKNAAWRSRSYPANRQLRRDFFEFADETYKISSAVVRMSEKINRIAYLCEQSAHWLYDRVRYGRKQIGVKMVSDRRFWKEMYLNRQLFIWAANMLSARTAEILRRSDPDGPPPQDLPVSPV